MDLKQIDKSELIQESYVIDGITAEECRSIFLDWALKLPDAIDQQAAIKALLAVYAPNNVDHPMTKVLTEGLTAASKTGRRGGRKARLET